MVWYTCLIKHAETLLRTKDCCTLSKLHNVYSASNVTLIMSQRIGGTCSMHWRDVKFIQTLGRNPEDSVLKTWGHSPYYHELQMESLWAIVWDRIDTSGKLLRTLYRNFKTFRKKLPSFFDFWATASHFKPIFCWRNWLLGLKPVILCSYESTALSLHCQQIPWNIKQKTVSGHSVTKFHPCQHQI
jgi:hypothetical protein